MKKTKIAIIGAGGIANSMHLPSLSEIPNCEITAVCDIVEEKAIKAAKKYNIPKTYTLMSQMLEEEEIDGVFCLVQPDVMYRVVYECIMAKKHVFMEKPAGINSYQADSLARLSQSTGKIIQVGMNRRYIPLVQHVLNRMRSITKINHIEGCFVKHTDISEVWHYMDAFSSDIVHAADLVRYMAEAEVVDAATVVSRNNSVVDNSWYSVMRFENGISANLKANYQTAARIHSFELHGPDASAYINLGFPGTSGCEATIIHSPGGNIYSQSAVGLTKQNIEYIDGIALAGGNINLYSHYGYKQEDEAFIAFLQGGEKPGCLIEDAAKSMHMMELLLECAI